MPRKSILVAGSPRFPSPYGSKAPVLPRWQEFRVTEDQIDSLFDGNIGLLLGAPSSGLIDVDLDSDAAVALAPNFLPPTGMIHGRTCKPRSHWWYKVDSPKPTKQFKTPSGASLAEVRGTGGQTVVPPSVHPSGETIAWDQPGEPAEIPADDLL